MEPVQKGGDLMLTLIVQVDVPGWMAQGVKEDLAMHCDNYGDTKVVQVLMDTDLRTLEGQTKMEGT